MGCNIIIIYIIRGKFIDQHHQCGDDDDDEDGDDISGPQLLDLPACEEISNSTTLTADQKYTALIDI